MGQTSREKERERRLQKKAAMELNRDYKAYRERYFSSPNEKKAPLMTKAEFEQQFLIAKEMASHSAERKRTLRGHKIGEHIFEFETSKFTEKEYSALVSGINRAREEILGGKSQFIDTDAVEAFMEGTKFLSDRQIRSNYTSYLMLLKGMFGSKEEFDSWMSPEVQATDI